MSHQITMATRGREEITIYSRMFAFFVFLFFFFIHMRLVLSHRAATRSFVQSLLAVQAHVLTSRSLLSSPRVLWNRLVWRQISAFGAIVLIWETVQKKEEWIQLWFKGRNGVRTVGSRLFSGTNCHHCPDFSRCDWSWMTAARSWSRSYPLLMCGYRTLQLQLLCCHVWNFTAKWGQNIILKYV